MEQEEEVGIIGNKSKLPKKKKQKKLLKYIILIIISIIIFLIFYLIFRQFISKDNENSDKSNNDNKTKINNLDKTKENETEKKQLFEQSRNILKEIKDFEKTLRKIENKEILEFRRLNSENILYDRDKYKKSENPDITVVLTMHNQAHCIHKALRSIQNQSLKNIEILVMLDCSYDNSTETIKKYMEEDERIVLVNHAIIEGIMRTRSEGIKLAKGKYITALDGDDAFIHKDILYNSLYIANLGNIDIVEFVASIYRNHTWNGFIHDHKANDIIYQPKLRDAFFIINERKEWIRAVKCRTIWGKIVKNEIFKKAIDNIGTKYTEDYFLGFEDTMMTVSLYQVAQSYYLLNQIGLYYSRDDKVGTYPAISSKKCIKKYQFIKGLDSLKYLNFLNDKFEDTEIEKLTLYHETISINYYPFTNYYKNIVGNFDMIYKIFDVLFESKYIPEKKKERLKKLKDEVVKKEKEVESQKKKII